jgi:hypothetical protein
MNPIALPHLRWLMAALWVAGALLTFTIVDAVSLRSWLALAVTALIPPAILLLLWTDGPPPTIAEVLHATEQRR